MDETPDENPYRAPEERSQPSARKQRLQRKLERPSGSNFLIATLLVLLGAAGWFIGLGFGLAGAGAWAEFVFYAGPVIDGVGGLWLLVLLIAPGPSFSTTVLGNDPGLSQCLLFRGQRRFPRAVQKIRLGLIICPGLNERRHHQSPLGAHTVCTPTGGALGLSLAIGRSAFDASLLTTVPLLVYKSSQFLKPTSPGST